MGMSVAQLVVGERTTSPLVRRVEPGAQRGRKRRWGARRALGPEVKLVGVRPHAFHRYRSPAIDFLCDPTALLARLLAPEGEPADQKEREHAALRLALKAEPLKSG